MTRRPFATAYWIAGILMSYMVRNPGLIPGFESVWNGDIGKKQAMVAEVRSSNFMVSRH